MEGRWEPGGNRGARVGGIMRNTARADPGRDKRGRGGGGNKRKGEDVGEQRNWIERIVSKSDEG